MLRFARDERYPASAAPMSEAISDSL